MGTPKRVPLILGIPHIGDYYRGFIKGDTRCLDLDSDDDASREVRAQGVGFRA